MPMYFNIINAEHISDYRVKLFFENGKSGIADLGDYAAHGEIFTHFGNMDYFKNFTCDAGTLCWGDGAVDIAPEKLYEMATGERIVLDTLQKLKTG
jgi:hypothetical protein